jgi:drug/metabolite transporter (DMT)-like permease
VFILLGGIWSSSFLWIKIAVQEIGPITLVAFRVLFGLLFGIAVILIERPKLRDDMRSWAPVLVLGITNVAIPFFLISRGEKSIDSAVAAVLDATVPLFTILIAHYLLRDDKMTVPKVLGLSIGFAGVVILVSKDFGSSPSSLFGEGAVVLASAFYAGSAVYARRTTEDTPSIMRSAGPLLSSTLVMWLATLGFEIPIRIPQTPITWIALLWLGILGSGLAFIMMYYLIHEIGPTRTSMVTYLFPLGGVVLGVSFLGEQLSWQLLAGATLIVASLVGANLQPKTREVVEATTS